MTVHTTINYNKGITINHAHGLGWADFAGAYTFTVPMEIAMEFKAYLEDMHSGFLIDEFRECAGICDCEPDDECNCDNDEQDEFACSNADMFIVFYNWLWEHDKECTIETEGDHAFWIWHDICHATEDDDANWILAENGSFTAYTERERLMQGAKLCIEHEDGDFAEVCGVLFGIASDFENRFDEPLFEGAHVESYA